jgi:hypothetical protein
MAPPRVERVETFQRCAELIEALKPTVEAPIWYRGVGKADYPLVPLLYRHPKIKVVSELIELEGRLLDRFRHRSIPYQDRLLGNDWEFLFLMQHYGVPTRLLDWSENPFIALYFAITDAEAHCAAGTFSGDAAVWVLNTQAWNSHILSPYWKGRVLSISDEPLIDTYRPTSDMKTLASEPVAVSGLHNSQRIVAQRGVFTIFGHNNAPMEQIFEDKAFPPEALTKFVLPQANLASFRDALFGMGYTDSMIYPDLPGLAKELKRQFGFEV